MKKQELIKDKLRKPMLTCNDYFYKMWTIKYKKLELLHSQLDELIQGNQLPIDELKILQSFVEDIREKHLTETNQGFNQALDFKINKWGF